MKSEFSNMTDDSILESKKRVGCGGGIFQLFDCQQLLRQGQRRDASGHAPKKNPTRRFQEKHRDSMESSRTSSSSAFTAFSPQPFFSRPPRNSPRSALKEFIKVPTYKDFPAAINEDDGKINGAMKPNSSPRPADLRKLNDLDESLRILFELKKGLPRFSYDGTEISQTGTKQASKHRELSRLSLDGKEDSLRCSSSPKFNPVLKSFGKSSRVPEAVDRLLEIDQISPSIVARLMGLESSNASKFEKPSQSPRKPDNMNQKIESLVEKRPKKAQVQHSGTEDHVPERAMIETKKKGNTNMSSVNSTKHRSNKVVISGARKFDASFTNVADLEGHTGPGKIRTSCSSNREKDVLNAQLNTVIPQLQQTKPDVKKKAYTSIPPCDSKSLRRLGNRQTSESVSPKSKLRHKAIKVQDTELQNSRDQKSKKAYRGHRSSEDKSLLTQSIPRSSINVSTRVSASSGKKKHSATLKELSAKELELRFRHRSCPSSAFDTLLKDGLFHSTVLISDVFNEYQDLPSEHSFGMESLLRTSSSPLSSRNNRPTHASIEIIFQEAGVLGRTDEEIYALKTPDHLRKESDVISMLDQISPDSLYKTVEKSKAKMLLQKLTSDVKNEILKQKLEVISSHDYKIKCHQSSKERKDENPRVRRPQVCDSFKGEVPAIILEIERLIFKDLINEVVNGETAVILETKQKQCENEPYAINGI